MTQVVVDTEWLAAHAGDPDLAIVDVRPPFFYGQGHIPGAVNLPDFYLADSHGGPPPGADLAGRLGELGIARDTHVIAYDDGAGYSASRLYWLLMYFRHPRVSVLDGGVTKWRREGRNWEDTPEMREAVEYRVGEPDPAVIVDLEELHVELGMPDVVVLDVRSPGEYLGVQPTSARNGHIPTAINIDWTNNLQRDNGIYRLRPLEELRQLYESAGVLPDKRILVYCQVGGRSSATFMVLRALGYGDVAMYPQGWQEWGNRGDTPVEPE